MLIVYTDRNLRQAFIELGVIKDRLVLSDATIEKAVGKLSKTG